MKIAAAPLGPFETNAYLVVAENGKDCCVVDAPKDAGPLLLAEIKKQGLTVDVDEIRHNTNTTFTATEVLPVLTMTTLPSGVFQGVQAAGDEVLRKMNAR